MEEENVPDDVAFTPENLGKGLAFLGMIFFLLTLTLYILSRGQPDMYHLFAEASHVVVMSLIALALVIIGYALTKVRPGSMD